MISPVYHVIKDWLFLSVILVLAIVPTVEMMHFIFWIMCIIYVLLKYMTLKTCCIWMCEHEEHRMHMLKYLKFYAKYTFTNGIIFRIMLTIDHENINDVIKAWIDSDLSKTA